MSGTGETEPDMALADGPEATEPDMALADRPEATGPDMALGPGPRTRVRRQPQRGRYDRDTIHGILDEGMVCHLGFCVDSRPVVVPTAYARDGDHIYLHGALANDALRSAITSGPVCITVTLVDAVILARSAFHHSFNYRSVVAFGTATEISDPSDKHRALLRLVDHAVPGRNSDARPPSDAELRATRVVRFDIDEASAKVRTGGPMEEPEDLGLDVWAGQIPLHLVAGTPVADEPTGVPAAIPDYVAAYRRPPRHDGREPACAPGTG